MKDVAVVILNWNGKDLLEQYLPDLIRYSSDARIIVADNASTDNSCEFISSNFPSVEIIRNQENFGFAGGYNEALKHVNSKFYLLLNSDVACSEGWLEPLIETMKDSDIAACQPKILSDRNRSKFEHAGASGGFLDKNYFPFCRGRIFGWVEKDEGQYDYPTEVFWASGAAMLVRSSVFWQHGGFDATFFAHMEEIDLCWRMKLSGNKIMVNPASVVFHLGGATLDYQSPQKTFLNFRNNLMMMIKNHQGLLFPIVFKRLCLDGIAGCLFLSQGKIKQTLAIAKAHFAVYRQLSSILKKRKVVKAQTSNFNSTGLFDGSITWNYYVKGVKTFSQLNQRLFKK